MTDTLLASTPGSPVAPAGGSSGDTGSRGARVAWLAIGSLFAAALLAFGTFSVVDVLAHERSTEITTHDGVNTVVIHSGDGTVQVSADAVAEVTASSRVSEGLRATGVSRSLDGDQLVLRSTCPNIGGTWCSVDWDVVVPRGTDIVVRSDDDRAEATGEFGVVDLRSEHDGVTFDGVARSVVAVSEHGNVTVRLVEAPDSVRALSEHGNVSVAVPDIDEGYRVDVRSNQGRTDIGVRTDPNAARTIDARSDHGNVSVSSIR
jgi:hypothetical protein